MTRIELTDRELAILEFVLMDLAEAIADGDRSGFSADEVDELMKKVHAALLKTRSTQH